MYLKVLGFFCLFNVCFTRAFPSLLAENNTVLPPLLTGKTSSILNITSSFETDCYKKVNEYVTNVQKELNASETQVNVKITECLMFCGYEKVGVVDRDGNIRMEQLKNMTQSSEQTFESGISKCSHTERTVQVCEKALKNVKCIFSEGLKLLGITY